MADEPTFLLPHGRTDEWVDQFRTVLTERLGHDPIQWTTTEAETLEALETAPALLSGSLPDEWLDCAENLSWLQIGSAGVDHVDLDALADRDIVLTTGSGIYDEPAAEQVLGYLLALERNLHVGFRQKEARLWERYRAREVYGKTIGVIGLGSIGSRVAELANSFDMTVLGTKRTPSSGPAVVDEIHHPDALHDVLPRLDYLVLACPLTEATRGLIGEEEFELLDDEAILVNVARGEIVVETGLIRALRSQQIRAAALDVVADEPLAPDSPLWDFPNVILTPHMAGSNPHYTERLARIVAENYEAFAKGEFDRMRNRWPEDGTK